MEGQQKPRCRRRQLQTQFEKIHASVQVFKAIAETRKTEKIFQELLRNICVFLQLSPSGAFSRLLGQRVWQHEESDSFDFRVYSTQMSGFGTVVPFARLPKETSVYLDKHNRLVVFSHPDLLLQEKTDRLFLTAAQLSRGEWAMIHLSLGRPMPKSINVDMLRNAQTFRRNKSEEYLAGVEEKWQETDASEAQLLKDLCTARLGHMNDINTADRVLDWLDGGIALPAGLLPIRAEEEVEIRSKL